MRIRRVALSNIRNHASSALEVAEGVNVITGWNGAGKTSILEAIALCTLTRSFTGAPDAAIVRRDADGFHAEIEGTSDYGVPRGVEVRFECRVGKTITLDGVRAANSAQVIGAAPTVVLSPDLKAITTGPPAERRRFVDLVISQAKRRYLEDLIDYRRILKQRNTVLSNARRSGRAVDAALVEPWNEGLIERSARLVSERIEFLREFEPMVRQTSVEVADGREELALRYLPDGVDRTLETVDALRDALWLRSRQVWNEEQRRGTTLFGAHRDDILLEMNGGDVRTSASQGQHKTLLIAMKIAEFHYLASQCAETPLILLDDIFGDLDARRAERVYNLSRSLAQTFITATSLDLLPFLRGRNRTAGDLHIRVQDGVIGYERSRVRRGRKKTSGGKGEEQPADAGQEVPVYAMVAEPGESGQVEIGE